MKGRGKEGKEKGGKGREGVCRTMFRCVAPPMQYIIVNVKCHS